MTPIKDEKKKPAARKSAGASTGGKKKTAAQQLEESLSESAKKAVAAVDKAAKSLPSDKELLESEQVTKMSADVGGWGGAGGADKMPENHGKVEHPRGHPDCLSKVTIVISGVLDSMMRNEATDYIKRHGGRVTSGVTGKTTFLLCGAYPAGSCVFRCVWPMWPCSREACAVYALRCMEWIALFQRLSRTPLSCVAQGYTAAQ